MRIEEEVFKRKHIDESKLLAYGFIQENNRYIYTKRLNDEMNAIITIENQRIDGKVIDLNFDEEYVNFRIEGKLGEYATKIKHDYISLLEEICHACFVEDEFVFPVSNQIARFVKEEYGILPAFIFEKNPEIGVFKHANQKWFGLIMEIPYFKLEKNKQGNIEILNIKVDENKMDEYLLIEGIYPSYHMSKKSWISIVLDGTVDLLLICELLKKSYDLIDDHLNYREWLIPCNAKYFDIENLFIEKKECIWKQSTNIHIGDLVYIYASKPFSSILFACEVLEIDIPYAFRNDDSIQYIMKIRHLYSYDFGDFTLERLKQYGVTTLRGPRHVPLELSKILKEEMGELK